MNDEPETTTDQEPEDEPIEGTGEELGGNAVGQPIRGTALVPPPPGREVLMPMDPDQVVSGMKAYQELLPRLLDESDYQREGNRKFVKKSGWRKIARAFNLSVSIVPASLMVERDETGMALRAECVARAQAPNGQISDGDGYCSIDEKRFQELRENRESPKAKNMKVENDLRATATTRAKNRAISDLVGMGEVSAEEIDGGGGGNGSGPPNGPGASETEYTAISDALVLLFEGEVEPAKSAYEAIEKICGGYMPSAVASSVVNLAERMQGPS